MTKRMTKGEGSVYQRGNGRIVGEYEDANGRKRYVSDKTKPDVRHKLGKLLQGLGLTKYEIHIDSRITGWLNEFGLPVALSPSLPLIIFVSPNPRLEPSDPT
jgi:hypothetical protein